MGLDRCLGAATGVLVPLTLVGLGEWMVRRQEAEHGWVNQ